MSTPTQLRSFWNEFETKTDKTESSSSPPTRSPIRSSRSSLQSNAFVQMDISSSNRLNSPYSSPMGPSRHQRKLSQRESTGSFNGNGLVPPFNKENYENSVNTGDLLSKAPKSIPNSDYDRFPLFMSTSAGTAAAPTTTAPVAPEPFVAVPEEPQPSIKNSRESDNFTKYLGSRNSRLSDATIIHHPIDWSTTSHTQSGSQSYDDYNDNHTQSELYNHSAYNDDNGHLPVTNEEDTSQIATPVPEDYNYTTPTINDSSAFNNLSQAPIATPDIRTPVANVPSPFPQTPSQIPNEYSHIKIKPEPTEEMPWTPRAIASHANNLVSNTANETLANDGFPSTPKIKTEPVDDSYNAYANIKIKKESNDDIYNTPRQLNDHYYYHNDPVIKTEPGLETPIFRVLGSGNNTPAFPYHSQFDYDSPEKEPVSGTRLIDRLQPSISEEPAEHYQTTDHSEAMALLKSQNDNTKELEIPGEVSDPEQLQKAMAGNHLQAQFQEPNQIVLETRDKTLKSSLENEESKTAQLSLESEAPIIDSHAQREEDQEKEKEREEEEEEENDDDGVQEEEEGKELTNDSEEEEEEKEEHFENALPPTIFAPGTKLCARPSMTFKDFGSEYQEEQDDEDVEDHEDSEAEASDEMQSSIEEENNPSFQPIDLPKLELDLIDLKLGGDSILDDMTKEFDKALDTKKKGYKVRENQQIIYATSAAATLERTKTERTRRISGPVKRIKFNEQLDVSKPRLDASLTIEGATPKRQVRQVSALLESDRGRVFVKVLGIKKIGLQKVNEKRARFNLVLSNGVQEIETPYRPLAENVSIDQEFELIVGTSLNFDLTLKTKWTKIAPAKAVAAPSSRGHGRTSSVTSIQTSASKSSEKSKKGFSRLFGSKKKTIPTPPASPNPQRAPPQPTSVAAAPVPVHDAWDDLTAKDGSFGRASIALKDFESQIFGKPESFDVPIYNHWATSGVLGGSKTRRPAYQVGVLQVQMMFVPRHSKREELPHTLKDALSMIKQGREQRELDKRSIESRVKAQKEAQEQERRNATKHEGFLSQLGGDCTYWRRRYFKLDGPELTAFSETTKKPRASINLVKAIRVVEDKSTLTEKMVSVGSETSAAGRRRRKSAFAEQEEAFMFVDSGFRIRFSNGEIIDFYADTMESKIEWVQVLKNVISKAMDAKVKVANLKEEINYMPSSKPLSLWVERVLDQESA